jgi:HK97 gp10 family phage protein
MPYSGNPTVKQFKTDMLNVTEQLKGDLEQTYLREADELMENMRGAVPVLSGELKASIRKVNMTQRSAGEKKVSILVLAGGPMTTKHEKRGSYDYAVATEFGTQKEKAEPFFYSSARLYEQAGRDSARETVDQAIAANNEVRALRAQNYSNEAYLVTAHETKVTVSAGGRGGATVIRK